MPQQTITSPKTPTQVGSPPTTLYTSTSTTYQTGSNGQIVPGSATTSLIYYPSPTGSGVVAATSTNGGQSWTQAVNPSTNQPVLGAAAQASLASGALKTDTQNAIKSSATKAGVPATQQGNLATSAKNNGSTPATNTNSANPVVSPRAGEFPQILAYPINRDSKQDYIQFTALKYGKKKLSLQQTNRDLQSTGSSVTLPIQGGISDQNGVTWNDDILDPLSSSFAEASKEAISGTNVGTAVGNSINELAKGITGSKAQVTAVFAGLSVGNQNVLTRATGSIVNPNLELLFKAPQLRPFTFSFVLSPREKNEAKVVRQIIRYFKQNMAVQTTEGNLFLQSPNVFEIKYINGNTGKDHPSINKIKCCALQSFVTDYTPGQTYMTFDDPEATMTQYRIQLSFTELEPVYSKDYTDPIDYISY